MTFFALTPGSLAARIAVRCGLARVVRKFRRDEDGATAVEFAIIIFPFVALTFAILETAIAFFAGQLLETAVSDAARLIRTGQAQQDGMGSDAFKSEICELTLLLFNCEELRLDVRVVDTFDSINSEIPLDEEGNLDTEDFTYMIGEAGQIVVVRVLYEWPVFINQFGNDLATLPNGNHLFASTVAFKNEPFPW